MHKQDTKKTCTNCSFRRPTTPKFSVLLVHYNQFDFVCLWDWKSIKDFVGERTMSLRMSEIALTENNNRCRFFTLRWALLSENSIILFTLVTKLHQHSRKTPKMEHCLTTIRSRSGRLNIPRRKLMRFVHKYFLGFLKHTKLKIF